MVIANIAPECGRSPEERQGRPGPVASVGPRRMGAGWGPP